MGNFKTWLESDESQKNQQLRDIWTDTFKALGLNGLADEDAAYQSLGKITYGQRAPTGNNSTFKGKKAAYKMLENGQIFNRLLQLQDPQIVKQVQDAKQWLGTNSDDAKDQNNGDTTVSTLLQKLFGQDTYQHLIDSDSPVVDAKLNKAPQMPPKNDMGMGGPSPDMQTQPDLSQGPENPMGTPPTPADNQQYQPQVQKPPRPAGNPMAV
jgi:hypothetical protein